MATRIVEGKKPYTGGKAINIDENKVISLRLRDENNLIIRDEGDNEIYVDLQLPDGIEPTDAFPVGITTGRVLVADDWDITGTIICAKTTSGDNIKILYGDDGTLWMDNGTGTFKQIYFKADVDAIAQAIYSYIYDNTAKIFHYASWDTTNAQEVYDWIIEGKYAIVNTKYARVPLQNYIFEPTELSNGVIQSTKIHSVQQGIGGKFEEEEEGIQMTVVNGEVTGILGYGTVINEDGRIIITSATTPSSYVTGTTWYDTTTHTMKVWNGTAWQSVGGGAEIEYKTQAEYNALLPGAESDGKHYFIYKDSTPSGRPLGANTVAYYPLNGDILDHKGDYGISGTTYDLSVATGTVSYAPSFQSGKQALHSQATSYSAGGTILINSSSVWDFSGDFTVSFCVRVDSFFNNYMSFVINRGPGPNNEDWYRWMCSLDTNRYFFFHGSPQYLSTWQPTLGTWYNITCSVSNGTYTIYINGTSIKSGSYSYSSTTPGLLRIGGRGTTGNWEEMFNGCISEIIIDGEGWDATKALERAEYLGFA